MGEAGRLDECIAAADRAIELDPTLKFAYTNRALARAMLAGGAGGIESKLAHYTGAIEDYGRAIVLQERLIERDLARRSQGPGVLFRFASRLFKPPDTSENAKLGSQLAKLRTDLSNMHILRGLTHAAAYDHSLARDDFARCIELSPANSEAYYQRGLANGRLGDLKSALRDFDMVISLQPNLPNGYMSRAEARMMVGDYDGAWEDIRICRRLGGRPPDQMIRRLTAASGRSG